MILETRAVPPVMKNGFVLGCESTRDGVVIDPGDDVDLLLAAVEQHGLAVRAILLTHAHLDHVGALTEMRQATGAPVYLHRADDALLLHAPAMWRTFGKQIGPIAPAEHELQHGDVITFGDCELQVIHTPGHTPGGVCLYSAADRLLIGGDTLFFESVGRTDLPGGDTETLYESIRTQLWALPDETQVFPGHGPPTTIGHERMHNPFVGRRAHGNR